MITSRIFPVSRWPDDGELTGELKRLGIAVTAAEARKIAAILGRDPTLVEAHLFAVEWSEHCSYKSSRPALKRYLPTEGPYVILGPTEDSGIVELALFNGERYGLVISHESHNHPSQVLPVEGAATGIGGIVRDVDCMGARVVAVADPLRFGDPEGKNAARTRWIARGVVDGIWEYGNALGVPNLGGDVFFDQSFDDNCLVNVVALGVLKESEIVHSRVPPEARTEPYDLVLVGKPTDASGFGGVTFASEILDEDKEEAKKGAVQIHDPFLKNVLLLRKANSEVLALARERGAAVGFKDLGGGGLACASSEIGADGGFGVRVDLSRVHVAMAGLLPEVIACAETQERYILAVPRRIAEEVLRIYNQDWELPRIFEGARASVIGEVTDDDRFVLLHQGEVVCDAPIKEVVKGILYHRPAKPIASRSAEPDFPLPEDLGEVLLRLLCSANICSREYIYRHYDTEVQGNAVVRPGEADAGVIAPLLEEGCAVGVALSVDGNPLYGKLDPYWAGANAVAEGMRNVACVGAAPHCLTDCLNYGNPEKPEAFWQFEEGVRGLSDTARALWLKGHPGCPVPVVSGNVSFYNESAAGAAVAPSPIIACVGLLADCSRAVTMRLKQPGNLLLLVGDRYDELGGSQYYAVHLGQLGAQVPRVRFEEERAAIHGTVEAIERGLVVAAHDISGGGLLVTLAEMAMGHRGSSGLGLVLQAATLGTSLRLDKALFSESGGIVLEVPPSAVEAVLDVFRAQGIEPRGIGQVTEAPRLVVQVGDRTAVDLAVDQMYRVWSTALGKLMRG